MNKTDRQAENKKELFNVVQKK